MQGKIAKTILSSNKTTKSQGAIGKLKKQPEAKQ